MDPVQKIWMYENWLGDQNDAAELAKNHAYLLASFWNPEAVKEMLGEGNVHESTDEEFEESSNMVRNMNIAKLMNDASNDTIKKRRKKRHLQG